MVSLCAFQDKQPFDCMTFLNTSFYEASPGSLTFQYNPSQLVGSGKSISYGHCWGACGAQLRGGIYKTEYFILFIVFIFLLLIVPCASSPVTSVSLVFRVSLCGNKEALEEVIGNTQSLNDNYRLYSKANQEFTSLQNTLFPRNKNNLLFVFTRTIKQKWRSRELISQAA